MRGFERARVAVKTERSPPRYAGPPITAWPSAFWQRRLTRAFAWTASRQRWTRLH